ncbi:unnamed protein product [marine sediment metagenome]|uniref:Uncharacterized protein n=1 Tax=marine sediment metagenome TaxID=412755 RepID=X1SQT0_9ZZZZ
MQERNLRLKTGDLVFTGIYLDNKAIVLGWGAETEAPNIILMRIITIRWSWPPVKSITAFTDAG